MAHNFQISNAAANAAMDALGALLNAGKLRVYAGTQAANANTALSGQTLLAELTFGNPAFGASAAGVLTANAIAQDSSADNTGTATWFRCVKSDGTTVVCDGTCGTSNADMVMATTSIVAGAAVPCSSFVLTHPEA